MGGSPGAGLGRQKPAPLPEGPHQAGEECVLVSQGRWHPSLISPAKGPHVSSEGWPLAAGVPPAHSTQHTLSDLQVARRWERGSYRERTWVSADGWDSGTTPRAPRPWASPGQGGGSWWDWPAAYAARGTCRGRAPRLSTMSTISCLGGAPPCLSCWSTGPNPQVLGASTPTLLCSLGAGRALDPARAHHPLHV